MYNCSAQGQACENPGNVSYYRTVVSQTNPNGSYFEFSNTPEAVLGGASFRSVLSGIGPGDSQFGLDLMTRGLGFGSGTPAITPTPLRAADNTGALPNIGGVIDWAINDYKPNGGGVNGAGNSPYNSVFRGGNGDGSSVNLDFSNLVQNGTVFTIDIAGTMDSDNILHWFNPLLVDGSFVGTAPLWATGRVLFSGRLSYDAAQDTSPGVDYYTGSINLSLEVPEPASMAIFGVALAGFAAVRRRRT